MRFNFLPLVLLVALVVANVQDVRCSPLDDGDDGYDDEDEETQIEAPLETEEDLDLDADYNDDIEEPEESEEEEEEIQIDPPADFDLDYNVKRPEKGPVEEEKECLDDDDDEDDDDDDDDDLTCIRKEEKMNLKPYEKYPGYNKWERRPLFVIIIGGLRWDYLTDSAWNMTGKTVGRMKAFKWIRKHGTTLGQVVPVFPPYDLPTWTSMSTGLYPQHTGVTGDYMYNLKTRKLFKRGDNLENWWVQGEPIWSLAAKNGRKVSVLNWHNCNLPGKNIEKPRDCQPFNFKSPIPTKQKLIQLFNQAFTKIHSSKYDLSIVYTDALKKAALRYGPNSQEVMRTLADLDDVLQGRLSDIKNKKERVNLKLNILLLSDYGLNTKESTTKIDLGKYFDYDHVQYVIQRGGSTILVPYALKTGDIMGGVGDKEGLGSIEGVDAYVREVNLEVPPLDYPEIPEELKYTGYTWTQDILLLAKPGYEIVVEAGHKKVLPPLNEDTIEKGTSGYHPNPSPPHIVPGRDKHKSKELRDREKMEGILYTDYAHMMKTVGFAWGPDFKRGYQSEPIEQVDIYQLMAFLLQVDPNPHDGQWDRVKGMLSLSGGENLVPSLCIIIPIVVLSLFS